MSPNELYSHFALVLPVSEMKTSLNFYRDKLEFELESGWGDPMDFALLSAGKRIYIHLIQKNPGDSLPSPRSAAYIFAQNIYLLYEKFMNKGVSIHDPLQSQDYQMREFSIKDPDGYILTFGQEMD